LADPVSSRLRPPATAETAAILLENLLRNRPPTTMAADVTHWQLADGTDVEMVLAASNLPPPFASLPRSAAETTETLWRWR